MALSAGTRLGPYEILEPLGAGGMGEVYRARDTRLKREVALKVLPAGLASEPERLERFEREAQALAALNHPHIVTIHSVEEAEGLHFLTMELVEGKTLSKVIPRGGLSLPHFFRIAIPLTEAVSAAHEKGVIHRDLKPGNVMVTEEDRIKVLDFGLAKLREDSGGLVDSQAPTRPATEAGRVLGTVPYMSPEQVQGQAVNHRSDVFSLGIVLYEMATGVRPFTGDTSAGLASSILRDTPPSVTERRADLPRDLGKLVKRCLEKEPKRRFQSTRDLANELEDLRREVDTGEALDSAAPPATMERPGRTKRRWLVGAAVIVAFALVTAYLQTRSRRGPPPADMESVERKRLVVLPFDNLGPPEDAYFAAGLTEEITNRLARVSSLGVISRTSAVQYDPAGKDIKQIGQDFAVGFVLEGTVRWDRQAADGGRVRISPQLIRVADDTHLWADSYDRVLGDIFAVQSEIAEAVVRQLGVALPSEERRAVEARPTENLEAYQAYLKGLDYHSEIDISMENQELAAQMFERAIELDSGFAAAHAMLAEAHGGMYIYGFDASPARLAMGREAAHRALRLDADCPEAHRSLGFSYYYERRYEVALEEFAVAARGLPNDAETAHGIACTLRRHGRFPEAIAEFERALGLDPQKIWSAMMLAQLYRLLHRYEDADRYFDLSIAIAPDSSTPYGFKAMNFISWNGSLEQARATLERMPGKAYPSFRWPLERYEREYQAALESLAGAPEPDSSFGLGERRLMEAELSLLADQPERARASSEAARDVFEGMRERAPDSYIPHQHLCLALAGLGRKAEAIRVARRCEELLPVSKDAEAGPHCLYSLALVYTMVGEHEAAIDELENLLSIPSWISLWDLRLDPRWDPLRDHPRFKKLVGEDWQAEASP